MLLFVVIYFVTVKVNIYNMTPPSYLPLPPSERTYLLKIRGLVLFFKRRCRYGPRISHTALNHFTGVNKPADVDTPKITWSI